MMVRQQMSEALDAAALAVGSSTGLTQTSAQTLAQQYFNANFTVDTSAYGVPTVAIPSRGYNGTGSVQLTATDNMPTVLMKLAGITSLPISTTSTVVWGQTKLWVSLVLDNTGSMTQTDSTGTSKISALQDRVASAAHHPAERASPTPATCRLRSCPSPSWSMSAPAMSAPAGSTGPTGRPRRPSRIFAGQHSGHHGSGRFLPLEHLERRFHLHQVADQHLDHQHDSFQRHLYWLYLPQRDFDLYVQRQPGRQRRALFQWLLHFGRRPAPPPQSAAAEMPAAAATTIALAPAAAAHGVQGDQLHPCLDGQCDQHLGRLHHGPHPELRHQRHHTARAPAISPRPMTTIVPSPA